MMHRRIVMHLPKINNHLDFVCVAF